MKKNIYQFLNLIIIAAIIYVGVDTFYRFIEPGFDPFKNDNLTKEPKSTKGIATRSRINDYEIINKRNIFGTSPQNSIVIDDAPETDNLEPTTLKISLIGTVTGNSKDAAAIIEDKSKKTQDLYRVGDSVQNAIIKNILYGKVVLSYNGRNEILNKDEPNAKESSPAPVVGRKMPTRRNPVATRSITLRRDDIVKSFSDINGILSQASIRPHSTDGENNGLAITGIKANSIFRKMGLRNGDIVKGVGGNEMKSPEDLISLYNQLKSEDPVSIKILRRGRERIISFRFR